MTDLKTGRQRSWSVYIDGRYMGEVTAGSESEARCAALVTFDPEDHEEVSVTPLT